MHLSTICTRCGARFDQAAFGGQCPACMLGDLNPANTLPGYILEGLVARGGMGMIYRARQEKLGREVAVKVLTNNAIDPEVAERFIREATVMARLDHPNIVPIHELGQDEDGQLFYAMKMVKGRTLQAIIRDLERGDEKTMAEFTLVRLLTIFRKVCDAMAFAHAQGVIHRDLKPENVMVGEFGEVLVMDWGLAKLTGDKHFLMRHKALPVAESDVTLHFLEKEAGRSTEDGEVLGTPSYMPPEQAEGRLEALDERSDVYALGGILYAMLTLRAPVEGGTLEEILENVRSGKITPPTSIHRCKHADTDEVKPANRSAQPGSSPARIPTALSAVAMRALSPLPIDRYQTVTELAEDVEAYQTGHATRAEKLGIWGKSLLFFKRHRPFSLAVFAAVLITAVLGVKVLARG